MSKQFATAAVAVLCLALVGCGSSGPNLQPELNKLSEQVGKQTEQLGELETKLDTERKEAAETEKELQEQVDEGGQAQEDLQEQLDEAEQAQEAAEQRARDAQQQAQEQIRRQAQLLEANQRAANLLTALEGLPDVAATTFTTDPRTDYVPPPEAAVSVAKRNTLTFGPSTARQSSSTRSGFRYAKVTDTFGRTRTTAIYTDRELSRRLLDHYGAHLEGTTRILLGDADLVTTSTDFFDTNSPVTLDNYGDVPRTEPTQTYNTPASLTSLSGKLHGQSGTFRCTGTDCSIMLTPAYDDDHDDDNATPDRLSGLTTSGIGVFEPGNASISLCGDTSACLFDDTEYMVFGYWIEDPESATGTYAVGPLLRSLSPLRACKLYPLQVLHATRGRRLGCTSRVRHLVRRTPINGREILRLRYRLPRRLAATSVDG